MIKQCLVCNIVIEKQSKQWSRQVYCSSKCRKSAHRKKVSQTSRIQRRRANMLQNDEVLYLIRQCQRAKTVQILARHDLKSFLDTMALVRERPKGPVSLCHISPVKGKEEIGLFHCRNLFYGGSYQNKKFSNGYISGGMSISRSVLSERWHVSADKTNNEILLMIEEYLGGDIVRGYLEASPVRKSKKFQVVKQIIDAEDVGCFDDLMRLGYKELCAQRDALYRRRTFQVDPPEESKFLAYVDSLTRFIVYDAGRAKVLQEIRDLMVIAYMALERVKESKTYNKYFYVKYEPLIRKEYAYARLTRPADWSVFKDLMYELAFKVLQGKEVRLRSVKRKVISFLEFPNKAEAHGGAKEL